MISVPVDACTRSQCPPVVAARHRAWAELHKGGMTVALIARATGFDESSIRAALDKQGLGSAASPAPTSPRAMWTPELAHLHARRQKPLRALLEEVATEHAMLGTSILGRNRTGTVRAARAEFCRRAHAEGYSWPKIGRFLGRDHTTCMAIARGKTQGRARQASAPALEAPQETAG